ncbi:PepSY domain-containing protein [Pseudoalteromonas sp. MMG005]|uniref:PepSY domain-containing protein n=1 Tax=Pseudoalteromonas sp. MMG005 TaxID=2822682 RepID=UPI001B3A2256|nr:PepSY domain-containing protein [Pseudoalteromonas sp. MMG005]MBQ4844727.1 PepSY domain-containing protein [Pseudoalteromonas sp. MMG005]
MIKSLLVWHRRLALLCVIPFIVWALSGLLHPAMSHFAKAERLKSPLVVVPDNVLATALPLKQVLTDNHITQLSHASIVEYIGNYYYQVIVAGIENRRTVYYSTRTGAINRALNDELYARYLAQTWSGQLALEVALINEFSPAYAEINRMLPVYRVTLSNENNLYVDTLSKRIAAHNTPLRESLSFWFKQLHTFEFVGGRHDLWRIIPMLAISLLLFGTAIFGLLSYSLLWRRLKNKRVNTPVLHRSFGVVLSVCMLGFSTSSIHILVDKFFPETFRALSPGNAIFTASLTHDPVNDLLQAQGDNFQLVVIGEQIFTQVVKQVKVQHKPVLDFSYWRGERVDVTSVDVATSLLSRQLNVAGAVSHWQKVDKFGPTYGFINKRLPVIQVSYAHMPDVLYSVEPHTGFIASVDGDWQTARSWHFGYFHKYHFLNPLGRGTRDIIMTFICIGLVITAGFGVRLYIGRRYRQKQACARRLLHPVITPVKSN